VRQECDRKVGKYGYWLESLILMCFLYMLKSIYFAFPLKLMFCRVSILPRCERNMDWMTTDFDTSAIY
jgi:hypothetical protein